jgi:hypothetical protein
MQLTIRVVNVFGNLQIGLTSHLALITCQKATSILRPDFP